MLFRSRVAVIAGLLILPFAFGGIAAAHAQGPYHVQATWKIGGEGRWDYMSIDPVSKMLYITRGDHVIAVDTQTGKQVADITGLKGTHGVVFGKDEYGFITDGAANAVAVFNRKTNQIVRTIPAGTNPDGVAFEPVTNTVWAFNGRSNDATAIDAKEQKNIATVALPGKPEFPVADGKGSVYANIEDKSEIVRIDARSHKVVSVWSVAPCDSPSGLAMDRTSRRLFSVCDGKLMAVVNADTGKVVATPAIGNGPDAAAFSPRDKYIFSSNGQGTLTVIHEDAPDKYTVVQNLDTKRGARTMAMAPDGSHIYLATADFGPMPAGSAGNPRPRPNMIPDTFVVLDVAK